MQPSAQVTIDIIDRLLTDDEKQILAIVRGQTTIPFKQLLTSRYGKLYSRYSDETTIEAEAAMIIDNNQLTLEKLKNIAFYKEKLLDPESFKSVTKVEGNAAKQAGVISTVDTSGESVSAAHSKSREGAAAYGEEFPIDKAWDLDDAFLLDDIRKLPDRHSTTSNWEFYEVEDENGKKVKIRKTEVKTPVSVEPKEGEPYKPSINLINRMVQQGEQQLQDEIYLHSVGIGSGRSVSVGRSTSNTYTGREIQSSGNEKSEQNKYILGRNIETIQRLQLINFKERFLNQFMTLFTKYPCR